MTLRTYVLNLIRLRERMIADGRSYRNTVQAFKSIKRIKTWLEFYPNATDAQVRAFLRKNETDLQYILPGKTATNYLSIQTKLNSLLHAD